MSNWQFEDGGSFDDAEAAHRWADRNKIAPQDRQVRADGKGVKLDLRRSALGDDALHDDKRDGRRTGW